MLARQAPDAEDKLRVVLQALGPAPVSPEDAATRGDEITLTLTNKFVNVDSTALDVDSMVV